jgi:two-component system response regulator DegU
MGISEKTVRNHMSHIYDKLDVRDRSGALLYAMRKGLVQA